MTKPTSHTGSGFSSSRGGDAGRGHGRSIRERLRTWPWQGRRGSWCQLPTTMVQGLYTAQPSQEEEASEGNGAQ